MTDPAKRAYHSWLRIEVSTIRRGWVSKLPAGQYAAWVKFLLEAKDAGNGGILAASDIDADWCAAQHLDPMDVQAMLSRAVTGCAVTHNADPDHYEIVNWNSYQPDPTNGERQRIWRENHQKRKEIPQEPPPPADSNGVLPLRNGCNGDVDGTLTLKETDLARTPAASSADATPPDVPKKPPKPQITPNLDLNRWDNVQPQDIELWKAAYPAVDIKAEAFKALAWVKANPKKWKKNWRKFLTGWLNRAQERGGTAAANAPQSDRLKGYRDWSKENINV